MRRWVCVIALLFGFAGDSYAWTIRARPPVPIERRLDFAAGPGSIAPTGAWWQTS
ncbi:MAG TPA: hypothetical protein VGC90_09915 [Candidatus Limnocylindrales bacterium]|jgi:hypothetical protein